MEGSFRDAPAGLRVIETLRLSPSGPVRADRHLARMARTCTALGFQFDEAEARRVLAEALGCADLRARLTVGANGLQLTCAPLLPIPDDWTVALASKRVVAGDPWRAVKTTHRGIYDAARKEMPTNVDELIFLNDRGEVAEGTITNVFVERGGKLVTPPVSSGALPGILREELLDKGRAVVDELAPDDLRRGRVYCGNSLRGLIPARLAD
ncbi:4-amino-4-deoxychorismate lyase [Palleronia marisminoris]|uniref:Probable branched-chain-amino-acid aminotransferase n=1 Tax=Palleronia marisminoris TaxID=315423 RepID=A0A1Y5R6M7_9RHOB|nr:aminotransferase class IV [Palleronia marisminoris]SFG05755.1 4-amino-4-deoxychorismate lyase [Palleronia marisminoris]SLN10471.1 putative branched-chain-amino-acid aminotransferase [Palleronia marisminoris]